MMVLASIIGKRPSVDEYYKFKATSIISIFLRDKNLDLRALSDEKRRDMEKTDNIK